MAQHEYKCQSCFHRNVCPEYHPETYSCVHHLDEADVATRAEVDKAGFDGYDLGKREVAREIFGEIDRIIKSPRTVGFCMTAPSFRQAISDYNEGIRKEILYYIDELKKKYTEAEPPKGDES